MIYNYFTIAIRNLLKNKVHALINIAGLTVGMACCILIGIYVQHELSYDRFHANADQIFRILRRETLPNTVRVSDKTSGAITPALLNHFPEAEQALRLIDRWYVTVEANGKKLSRRFMTADPGFLDTFTFPLIKGDAKTALKEPYSILLTEQIAYQFFGTEDPIGQTVQAGGANYTITGILKDIPQNSSMYIELLTCTIVPESYYGKKWDQWRHNETQGPLENYVVLPEGANVQLLEQKLNAFLEPYIGSERAKQLEYYFQPLTRVHLYSHHDYGWRGGQGNIDQVYTLSAVGCFVLLISCVNFINLTTALSGNRATEIGIRKSVGAYKGQLIQQFLSESTLMAFMSLVLAIGIAQLALPAYSTLIGKNLSLIMGDVFSLVGILFVFTIFVGFLAGCYPAFYLSASHPVGALKGELRSGRKNVWIRKGLMVFQFSISVILILGTAVTYEQARFMRHTDKGYNQNQIVVLDLFRLDPSLKNQRENIKQAFLTHPNVRHAAATSALIGSHSMEPVRVEGQDDRVLMRLTDIDHHALQTFDMKLIAGRNLSEAYATDQKQAYIINETAAKAFGWENPIGKEFEWLRGGPGRKGTVIGVVKDFHHFHLKYPIEPLFMCYRPRPSSLSLQISPDNQSETFAFLKQTWQTYMHNQPFEYRLMHDLLDQNYQEDYQFSYVFRWTALLAIFVTIMGLIGLASFTMNRRAKEISIRKVLGASISSILLLLSSEFFKLIITANAIALPLGYLLMRQWLSHFAYRIDLSADLLVLAGLLVFGVTCLVVGRQALKSAAANPVDNLRCD